MTTTNCSVVHWLTAKVQRHCAFPDWLSVITLSGTAFALTFTTATHQKYLYQTLTVLNLLMSSFDISFQLPEKFRQDVRSAVNGVMGMVGLGGQQAGIGKQQDVAVRVDEETFFVYQIPYAFQYRSDPQSPQC